MTRVIVNLIIMLIMSGCNKSNNTSPEESDMKNESAKDSISNFQTGYADVNGLKMYYEIYGKGAPLVLIHGGGSTIHTTFGRIIPLLAPSCKVIAVEMQAHGHTADINRPLSFEQDADDIAALLKYLKIEKADIFGFSNGASTTLQFAIRHPEMINKIIVGSTFYKKAGAPDWFWKMMSNPTFEGMPQMYKDAFLKINPDTNALQQMYKRDVARMQGFPDITEKQMKEIKAPALIIIGNNDVVTPEHAVEMHQLLRDSQVLILPGGHGDYIGEITTPKKEHLIVMTAETITTFLSARKTN